MRRFIWISLIILLFSCSNSAAMAAEETYLKSKSDDGSVLILADGSVWAVSPVDQIDSALWLPLTTIIIPDNEDCLINSDDGEKVDAHRIR